MQILINIPDFIYKHILKKHVSKRTIAKMFENGTILPKGHGRIADMDEAIKCIEGVSDSKEKQYALCLIDWACSKRVLIEADKEDKHGEDSD